MTFRAEEATVNRVRVTNIRHFRAQSAITLPRGTARAINCNERHRCTTSDGEREMLPSEIATTRRS